MNWELFVGLRYLRSRRREAFVSVITIISTLSVLIGVMVLTVVLAVMTGFEEDLRARILGLHPHLRVGVVLGEGMGGEAADIAALVADDSDVDRANPGYLRLITEAIAATLGQEQAKGQECRVCACQVSIGRRHQFLAAWAGFAALRRVWIRALAFFPALVFGYLSAVFCRYRKPPPG